MDVNELIKSWGGTVFPDMIRSLPEALIKLNGIRGWLLQGDTSQVVFFDIDPVGEVPPHSHCAQWGIMVSGRMLLTIDGKTKEYASGDWYYIPRGVVHSATFLTRVNAIDVFADPKRYQVK